MQVGAADTLVGELVDHLRASPAWEDTLLVVTSDHGTNLTPPDIGRMHVTDANREEVYRVPLFIKAPGQVDGRGPRRQRPEPSTCCRRSSTSSTPTSTGSSTATRCSTAARRTPRRRCRPTSTAAIAIAARRAEQFPHGDDWMALAAVGEHGDLVGTRRRRARRRRAERVVRHARPGRRCSAALPTDDGRVAVRARRPGDRAGEPARSCSPRSTARSPASSAATGRATAAGTFTGYVADRYRRGRATRSSCTR